MGWLFRCSPDPKHCVPDCRHSSALDAQTSECELTLASAMQQLDAGDRGSRVLEPLEAEHRTDALLDASGTLLDQAVQVVRGSHLDALGQDTVILQLAHRAVRRRIAIERDGLRYTLALGRLGEESLGRSDVALGAEMEVHRLAHPVDGTVEVALLAPRTLMYVSSTRQDRPTGRPKRFQRLANSGA